MAGIKKGLFKAQFEFIRFRTAHPLLLGPMFALTAAIWKRIFWSGQAERPEHDQPNPHCRY